MTIVIITDILLQCQYPRVSGVTGQPGVPVSVPLIPVRRRSTTGPETATFPTLAVAWIVRERTLKLRSVLIRVSLYLITLSYWLGSISIFIKKCRNLYKSRS